MQRRRTNLASASIANWRSAVEKGKDDVRADAERSLLRAELSLAFERERKCTEKGVCLAVVHFSYAAVAL